MQLENNMKKHESIPVEMHSFAEVEEMINFFYANKSRYQVMKGEKSYSNPNPPDLALLKK